MIRYWLILCLLAAFSVACSPAAGEVTGQESAQTEEMHEENELEHEAEHEDEHDEDDEHSDDDAHREHGAHEHGAAVLTIAWSGNELAIDLETPAYNVLGFEHAPSTEAEQAQLDESLAALQEGALLVLSPEAACALLSADVTTGLEQEEEEEEAGEETHSDIDVAYHVECRQPENLTALDAGPLFARFPNFESLRVQWVSDTGQSATELTPDDTLLTFENG